MTKKGLRTLANAPYILVFHEKIHTSGRMGFSNESIIRRITPYNSKKAGLARLSEIESRVSCKYAALLTREEYEEYEKGTSGPQG